MAGPFRLTASNVESHTWPDRPGVYVLKQSRDGPPRYVGRSDSDVRRRLNTQARETGYKFFTVEHKKTALDAWKREAHLYHYHKRKLDNDVHPNPPKGHSCPRCSLFD